MIKFRNVFYIIFMVLYCCKKPFDPPAISTQNSYLVVEGIVNSGSDSTFIKLGRTVNISNKIAENPELHATVTVEGDQNTSYPLKEIGNGMYVSAGLNLDNSHKYRLDIKTSNNKQYLSDYVEVLNSPLIDSISYDTNGTVTGPGLNIYANTHDVTNKVRYYRWDYQETWEFHSNFESYFKSNGDTVLDRDMVNDNIYTCWQSDISTTIVLGTSSKLAQNVIFKNPITAVVSSAEKLGVEYSILVKQYALSADAYTFYTNLKKNTEQLGSIFDAQPSEISGNIHCVTSPTEPVLGYLCVGSTASQRIFISKKQLPGFTTTPYYTDCMLAVDNAREHPCCYYVFNVGGDIINEVDEFINYDNNGGYTNPLIPVQQISMPGHPPEGYTAAIRECVDCTLRGTNKQPAFWK